MTKRIVIVNIIILLVALFSLFLTSYILLTRNVTKNNQQHIINYSEIVKDEYNHSTSYQTIIDAMQDIDGNIRITFIDLDGYVIRDSLYGSIENTYHGDREEIMNLEEIVVRNSITQDMKVMFYAIQAEDCIIRIGLPYNQMFEDISQLFYITTIVAIIIFVAMSILLANLTTHGMRPLNKVVSGLEELVGSSEEYHYDDIKKITNKIVEVKERLSDNMEKIITERDKVEFVLNNIGQGIAVLDSNFDVVMINNFVCELYQFNHDEVLFKSIFDFEIDEKILKHIKNTIISDSSIQLEFEGDNGKYYNIFSSPIENKWVIKEKGKKGIVIVITDITESKILDMKQKEFFTNASHELRSPLTSIIGFQEMIQAGIINTESDFLDISSRTLNEGNKMRNLINSMLDLTALEQTSDIINPEEINIKLVIEETLDSLAPQILKKNIELDVNIIDAIVYMNKEHVYHIIRNLIDNGIKYNKQDGKLSINVLEVEDRISFSVEDTGIGIAKDDLARLFERFYRVDKARGRESGSSGLGLSIVKQICNLYNSKINIESEEGKWTKITILFEKK